MHMTLGECKTLSSLTWSKKFRPRVIDMSEDEDKGRYRVGLDSIFLPLNVGVIFWLTPFLSR